MNIQKLKIYLQNLHVPENWYFLGGYGNDDQKYCLEQENGTWNVYYSERGVKFRMKKCSSEEQACKELYERLTKKLSKHNF